MRKHLIVFFFSTFIFFNYSSAQKSEKHNTKFGVRSSVSYSNMNFNKGYPTPTNQIRSSWDFGFAVGCLLNVPITKELFFRPEYLFSYLRSENETTEKNYNLSYFSLPVLLQYQLTKNFSLMTGPQFDLLINGKEGYNGIKNKVTKDMENRHIGVSVGAELKLLKFMNLELRGIHSFNKVGIGHLPDVREFKFEVIQAGANFVL